ncbi:MAG TPA: type IV pilus twitching motility protein PilT [Candidatus Brocadiia bacterium]|nr:type IV pilus twitching motility protein PilT [Candidatus Brocadiia bacterium]
MAEIDKYLQFLVKHKGSDLHICTGSPPLVRIDGDLQRMKLPPIPGDQVKAIIMEILPESYQKQYIAENDVDFAYEIKGVARFRTNAYVDRNGPGICMRMIPLTIMTADDLGLNKQVRDLAMLPKGLVLVTGPTGCGKTTTLAALIDLANRQRRDHIITMEDPVEFVHPSRGCLVTHRQVKVHTTSFSRGLRAALREDPDIMLVGELRDLETTELAILCAETGHLVFATVHTTTASSTVDRVVDQFPPDHQEQIRTMLSSSLKAVITQALCKKKGGGRVAAFEILVVHSGVSNLIREKKTYQITSVIQTGKKLGMCSMNESLMRLVLDDVIEPEEAFYKCVDKADLNHQLNMHFLGQVQSKAITVEEAMTRSFNKFDMFTRLQNSGFGRDLKKLGFDEKMLLKQAMEEEGVAIDADGGPPPTDV